MSNREKKKLHDYVYYNYIYIYKYIRLIEFYGDRYRCDNVLFLIKCVVLYDLWQKYL